MDDGVLDEIMASVLASRTSESFTSDGVGFTHTSTNGGAFTLPPITNGPWSYVTTSNARTVDIGNKESARIVVTVRVACTTESRWSTLTEANKVTDAILNAEVTALGGKSKTKYKPSIDSVFTDAANPRIMLGIEYGLTLNLGNYQFAKPATGMTVTCSAGTLNETYADIITGLKTELGKMVKEIRSGKKNTPDIGL